LIDFINTNNITINDEINNLIVQVNNALDSQEANINTTLADQEASINTALAGQEATVNNSITTLTNYVNDQVAAIIGNSVTVAESVMNEVALNNASTFITTLNGYYADKDTQTEIESGRLSDANLNLEFANKATQTEIESGRLSDANLNLEFANKATQTEIESGRLSETSLNGTYVSIVPIPDTHVIFIGSSNSQSGWGWTPYICTRNNWIEHNYAIGGAGFQNPETAGSFKQQTLTAIADTTFDKTLVKFIFITDMSNDMRGNTNVQTYAADVFSLLDNNYPNARIIVIPAVWTYTPDNWNTLTTRQSVTKRYTEARKAGENFSKVELVNYSWLWFWDDGDWLQGVAPNYHLNSAGYNRLVWYIEQYLKGIDHANDLSWKTATQIASTGVIATGITSRRVSGVVTVEGTMTSYTVAAIDTDLCKLIQGAGPIETLTIKITGSDRNSYTLYIYPDGTIRALTALPGGLTYWVNATYAVM
jgi:hypothetical protein